MCVKTMGQSFFQMEIIKNYGKFVDSFKKTILKNHWVRKADTCVQASSDILDSNF